MLVIGCGGLDPETYLIIGVRRAPALCLSGECGWVYVWPRRRPPVADE